MAPVKDSSQEPSDEGLKNELESNFSSYSESIFIKDSPKQVTLIDATAVINRLAKTQNISVKTASIALAALLRKGAANAGAPDTMETKISCPDTKKITVVTRYDVGMALQAITGHKTIRKLAEVIAPQLVKVDLKLIKLNPLYDLKGDLANKINRILLARKEDPLTREEEVCCATYTQWMPNLNELASSTRLKALLDEDLNTIRNKQNKRKNKKTKADSPQNQNNSQVKVQANLTPTVERPAPQKIQTSSELLPSDPETKS